MSATGAVKGTVKIDILPQGVYRNPECDALVCIDVMLASSMIVTAVSQGRPTHLPTHIHEVLELRHLLKNPLLAQETPGRVPAGFEEIGLAGLSRNTETTRPLVLVSPWTSLLAEAPPTTSFYIASFRNLAATAEVLAERHERVVLLEAGFGGDHRCEDRIAASAIARELVRRGFQPEDMTTSQEIDNWAEWDRSLLGWGKSAESLRRLGQHDDLAAILNGLDDLHCACRYNEGRAWAVEPGDAISNRRAAGVVFAYISQAALAADDDPPVAGPLGIVRDRLDSRPLAS
jgi:phosphosulfolactate phosphohydrolase-like enzyme